MNDTILHSIVILLAVSVVAVIAFRRLNLPPILAYLFVGVLVGPHGWGWIPDTDSTRFLAEFGVVFLLFTVGLEFSLPTLIAMRKEVLVLGGTQVVVTTVLVGLVAWMLGESLSAAVILGGALAMSSTAIVVKQLTEQLELNSRHGRQSVGVLLFQDLAVIPFLVILPALGGDSETSLGLKFVISLVEAVIVLACMLALGHWLLRPIFHLIAKSRSSELFTLSVLLFSIAAAWVTDLTGLSLALGAFLAGMMLGETEFRHQVATDIRPFRDVLLGLFFITVGMLLDVRTLPAILPWVLVIVAILIVVKVGVVFALSTLIGSEKGVALRTGISLAQGGEFGFALITLAVDDGVLSFESSQAILASIIVSMALTPWLIRYNGRIAKAIFRESYGQSREKIALEARKDAESLHNHVIICGFGRIGQNVARFLEKERFQYIALDLDPVRVREARQAGERVNYGDSTHSEILEAAGIARCKVLVVSYDDVHAAQKILQLVRQLRPELPVLVRTRDDTNLDELQAAGASEVIPETLEASIMLSSSVLILLGVPVSRVVKHVQDVRAHRYQLLRQFFHGQEVADLSEPTAARESLHSVTIPTGAYAANRTLGELNLESCQVTATLIRRHNKSIPNPPSQTLLHSGDVLVLYGTPEDLEHAESVLLSG